MSRQRLGQHFLTSPHILERIAVAACGEHVATAVEIGPGRGALTAHLLTRVDRLIAVELDPALLTSLRDRFPGNPKLTVIHGDALDQDFAAWNPDVVCGNLPYYAATPILERTVRAGIKTVALIQREVAERMTARPGTREYGYLTCAIGLFAEAAALFHVKPGSFQPPPKVDSTVVRLTPREVCVAWGVDPDGFLRFLGACFRLKRKTLRNNLMGLYGRELLSAAPKMDLRAEQLSLEELAGLFRVLGGAGHQQREGVGHDGDDRGQPSD